MIATSPVAPPLVDLARLAGWRPVPLRSVTHAVSPDRCARGSAAPCRASPARRTRAARPGARPRRRRGARRATVTYPAVEALHEVDLVLQPARWSPRHGPERVGEVDAPRAPRGSRAPSSGTVVVGGADPCELHRADRTRAVGLVPQRPAPALTARGARECSTADPRTTWLRARPPRCSTGWCRACRPSATRGTCRRASGSCSPWRSCCRTPRLVLLDEPTRGLDYTSKARLEGTLRASPPRRRDRRGDARRRARGARGATGACCSPTARWWPTGAHATSCATRRCSRPRSPRCSRRSRGSPSTRFATRSDASRCAAS